MTTISRSECTGDEGDNRRLSTLARSLPTPTQFVGVLGTSPRTMIPLLGGNPADEGLPTEALAQAVSTIAATPSLSVAALQYSGPRGLPGLISWLAGYEGVSEDRIVITNGGLHALSLVTRAVLDAGEIVATDDPVFPIFPRVLQLTESKILPIPVDHAGFDVSRLEQHLAAGLRPRLVYTVPDFQNPTGTVLSADRRARLLELAERYGFLLISDNPYRGSRWRGTTVEDFPTDSDRVVKVDTFAKTLGPGLRLGWLVLPPWLVTPVLNIRSRTDQHPSTVTQAVVQHVLAQDGFFAGVQDTLALEHSRRAAGLAADLRSAFGDRLRFREPDGGFFLWAEFADPGYRVDRLHEAALRVGTNFSRGTSFVAPGGVDQSSSLRLGFSSTPPEQITKAVERLAEAHDIVSSAR